MEKYFKETHTIRGYPSLNPDEVPYTILDLPIDPNIHYATKEELADTIRNDGDSPWFYKDITLHFDNVKRSDGPISQFWKDVLNKGFYLACMLNPSSYSGFCVHSQCYLRIEKLDHRDCNEINTWKLTAQHIDSKYNEHRTIGDHIVRDSLSYFYEQQVVYIFPLDKVERHTAESFLARHDYFLNQYMGW